MAGIYDFGAVMAPVNNQVAANQQQYGNALQNNLAEQQVQMNQQNLKAQQAQQAQMASFNQDWAAAQGDPAKLNDLIYKHPQMIGELKNRIGLTDDIKSSQAADVANAANVALTQGPQAVQNFIQQNASGLQQLGIDPQDAWQQYQQNPEGFRQAVSAVQLSSMASKDQLAHATELQKNSIAVRGQDLDSANKAADRNLRYIGLQNDRLKMQIDQSGNGLKQQQLQQQLDQNNAAQLNTKRDWLENYNGQTQTLNNYNTSLSTMLARPNDDFENATGLLGKARRAIPGSDANGFWTDLAQIQGQTRQVAMQSLKGTGSISNAEGESAQQAFLALNENSSPEQIKSALKRWQSFVDDRRLNLAKTQGSRAQEYQRDVDSADKLEAMNSEAQQRGVPQGAIDLLRQNANNASVKEQFKAKFGYLPEGL